jgi:hypothetical protein
MTTRQHPTMSIDWQATTKANSSVRHQLTGTAALTKTRFFELMQNLEGEAVVDLGHVNVFGPNSGCGVCSRCRVSQANYRPVISVRKVVGTLRTTAGDR